MLASAMAQKPPACLAGSCLPNRCSARLPDSGGAAPVLHRHLERQPVGALDLVALLHRHLLVLGPEHHRVGARPLHRPGARLGRGEVGLGEGGAQGGLLGRRGADDLVAAAGIVGIAQEARSLRGGPRAASRPSSTARSGRPGARSTTRSSGPRGAARRRRACPASGAAAAGAAGAGRSGRLAGGGAPPGCRAAGGRGRELAAASAGRSSTTAGGSPCRSPTATRVRLSMASLFQRSEVAEVSCGAAPRGGNRIEAAGGEGVTARDPPGRERHAPPGSPGPDRLLGVVRAARQVPAARAQQRAQHQRGTSGWRTAAAPGSDRPGPHGSRLGRCHVGSAHGRPNHGRRRRAESWPQAPQKRGELGAGRPEAALARARCGRSPPGRYRPDEAREPPVALADPSLHTVSLYRVAHLAADRDAQPGLLRAVAAGAGPAAGSAGPRRAGHPAAAPTAAPPGNPSDGAGGCRGEKTGSARQPPARCLAARYFLEMLTASCRRPLRRRRLMTARPALVLIRLRNPWVRFRLLRCGWNVRFTGSSGLSSPSRGGVN